LKGEGREVLEMEHQLFYDWKPLQTWEGRGIEVQHQHPKTSGLSTNNDSR